MTTTYINHELSGIPGSYICEECDRWVRGPHHPSMGSLTHGHDCSRHPRNIDGFKSDVIAIRIAQRDAIVKEVIHDMSGLAYAPSRYKASEVREICNRALSMMQSLHTDVKGWENS